jgi:molybdopterin-guanine dinucleotide biosynthesis protein A
MDMLTGVILAGGSSRRMGGDNKSLLMLGGETLIERQVRIMRTVCNEIIIVTNTPRSYLRKVDESVRIITDYIPSKGPLSGIHAGLTLAQNQEAWIVGCDMPFLSPEAAELQLRQKEDGYEAIFPSIESTLYPLSGVYDRDCAQHIWNMLMNGDTQIQSLIKVLNWQQVPESDFKSAGIDTRFVKSIKTYEDYCEVTQQLSTDEVKMNKNFNHV